VIVAQGGLIDRQRPLERGMGAVQVAQVVHDQPEVVDVGGGLRMLRAERLGVQSQCPAQLRLGIDHIAQLVRQSPEVAQVVGEVRMVGTKLALPCLDHLLKIVALGAQVVQTGHSGVLSTLYVADASKMLKGQASYSAEMSFPV
jgi:hypothetical protein